MKINKITLKVTNPEAIVVWDTVMMGTNNQNLIVIRKNGEDVELYKLSEGGRVYNFFWIWGLKALVYFKII